MIINLDISAGAFISRGNLISVALKFLRLQNDPSMLAVDRLPDRERIRLERFLKGIRICTTHRGEEAKKMTFSACALRAGTSYLRRGFDARSATILRHVIPQLTPHRDQVALQHFGAGHELPAA